MSAIILASKSPFRAQLLKNAGIEFETQSADIDERTVEAPLIESGLGAADVAEVLAMAKASDVAEKNPGTYVIGSDQTLSLNGELMHKPEDLEAARRRLLALSGKTHELNSAVVIAKDSEVLWRHVEICRITFRKLDPGYIGRHVSAAGDTVLSSVGAYQIEGIGVQLFEKIEGDYFSIMGLPLLPLLEQLRKLDLIDA